MSHRTVLGFKLAFASICFLALTIASAVGLRAFVGYPDQPVAETKSGFTTGIETSLDANSDLDREPASFRTGSKTLVFEPKSKLNPQELSWATPNRVIRGQRAYINIAKLLEAENPRPRTMPLNLFSDKVLNIDLQAPSVYSVNSGLLVGLVEGDPESSVRIMVQDGKVDGTIRTQGLEYRVFDGGNGLHIVTEAPAP